jgi:lipopolysaccharide transport system permease protein
VTKIYFPRLILPLSGVLSPLADFAIAFLILIGMMIWFGIAPTVGILTLPIFVLLAICTALAVALWLAALNVRYRDVRYTIPFLVQIWMFLSPVAYSVSLVPEKWRWLYSLNPMAGVIEGFRWALLGNQSPDFYVITISASVVIAMLVAGVVYFRQMERTFADEV